jgi:hypothetical protein
MKPEATETPIPSLNTSYPAGPFSGSPSPARAFYTSYPAGPFSAANSHARAHTCPKTGLQGQCGQVRTTRPCRRILDRPRTDRMS